MTGSSFSRRSSALCLLLLACVTAVFFNRVLLHPDQTLWSLDIPASHSEYKLAQWNSFADWGRFPLWDPVAYCGKSIVGDSLPAVLNFPQWLFWLTPSPVLFGYILWFYATVGVWGMFLFAKKKGCDPQGAMLASVVFALGGKTSGHLFAGHFEVLATVLCLPWIMLAAEAVLEKPSCLRSATLGATFALASTCGSIQIIYWDFLFVSMYAVLWLSAGLSSKGLLATVRSGLAFAAGILSYLVFAAPWWFPIARQTLLLSARARGTDYDFASQCSPHYADLLRLIWPFHGLVPPVLTHFAKGTQSLLETVFYVGIIPFALLLPACLSPKKIRIPVIILAGIAVTAYFLAMKGGRYSPIIAPQLGYYWEVMVYVGIVPLALLLPACVLPGKNRVFVVLLIVLTALVTLLAMGESGPLLRLAVRYVPGFVMFRCPGRLFFYTAFLVALIVGLFVSGDGTTARKRTVPAVSGVLFAVAIAGAFLQWRADGDEWPARAWLPIAVLASFVPASLLWARGYLSDNLWKAATLLLVCCDLFIVLEGFMVVMPEKAIFQPAGVGEFLAGQKQGGEFRAMAPGDIMDQTHAAKYGIEIAGGYHPGVYGRYLDLYKAAWKADMSDSTQLQGHLLGDIAHPVILDLMNVTYFIEHTTDPAVEGLAAVEILAWAEGPSIAKVYRRDSALPRVCIVPGAALPAPGISLLDAVCAMDPKAGCLVEDRPFSGGDAFRPLPFTRESASDLTVRFKSEKGGVVLISQAWHPDWRATDHGQPVEVRRVNYDFVGVCAGPGDHEIRVWYRPWDFYLGCGIAAAAWAVLAVAAAWAVRRRRRLASGA